MQLLDWSYEKTINGLPGTQDAHELAEDYRRKHPTTKKSVDSLIKMQNIKAGTTGFLTGLGGIKTLPVAIPANIVSVVYIQMRMVAAIAILNGYNVKDDQVKKLVYVSPAGNGAADILKHTGIEIGKKMAISTIKKIPGTILTKINQKVGFRLLTKFGEKGTVNLFKVVPVLGGVVGATVDTASTISIGKAAEKIFVSKI